MTQFPETRESLIVRLGDHTDEVAWAEFLEIYEPLLGQLASRWGLQQADADEDQRDQRFEQHVTSRGADSGG